MPLRCVLLRPKAEKLDEAVLGLLDFFILFFSSCIYRILGFSSLWTNREVSMLTSVLSDMLTSPSPVVFPNTFSR